jgi:hypothetical protein
VSHLEQAHGKVICRLIANVGRLKADLELSYPLDFQQTRTDVLYSSKLDIIMLEGKLKLLK